MFLWQSGFLTETVPPRCSCWLRSLSDPVWSPIKCFSSLLAPPCALFSEVTRGLISLLNKSLLIGSLRMVNRRFSLRTRRRAQLSSLIDLSWYFAKALPEVEAAAAAAEAEALMKAELRLKCPKKLRSSPSSHQDLPWKNQTFPCKFILYFDGCFCLKLLFVSKVGELKVILIKYWYC